jgi:hypothetical protein
LKPYILKGKDSHNRTFPYIHFKQTGIKNVFADIHNAIFALIRERLAVNKQRLHRFRMEGFKPKKLNEIEGKEKYRVEVSNRFAALEDLDSEVEINSA